MTENGRSSRQPGDPGHVVVDLDAQRGHEGVRVVLHKTILDTLFACRRHFTTSGPLEITRPADRFRAGHAFLMGRRGARRPAPGAFGLNTGIADAHNLAWKLADQAGPALLDSYEAERRPDATLTFVAGQPAPALGRQPKSTRRSGRRQHANRPHETATTPPQSSPRAALAADRRHRTHHGGRTTPPTSGSTSHSPPTTWCAPASPS
ncbi:FAD-dependent monooxygenase [Actinomadura rubrisoli]|uniref:FAD-dependent monooxygenase n=1 Tax=Actinomadura rubrisoli TaxID=2530368 RepID=UPI003C7B122A